MTGSYFEKKQEEKQSVNEQGRWKTKKTDNKQMHPYISGNHVTSIVNDHVVQTALRVVASSRGRGRTGRDGRHAGEAAGETLGATPGHVADRGLGQGVGDNSVQKTSVQSDLQTGIDQATDKVLGNNRGVVRVNTSTQIVAVRVGHGWIDVDLSLDSRELLDESKEEYKSVNNHNDITDRFTTKSQAMDDNAYVEVVLPRRLSIE